MEKATAEEFKVQWVNLCACIDLDSCVNMINVFLDRVQQRLIYCTVSLEKHHWKCIMGVILTFHTFNSIPFTGLNHNWKCHLYTRASYGGFQIQLCRKVWTDIYLNFEWQEISCKCQNNFDLISKRQMTPGALWYFWPPPKGTEQVFSPILYFQVTAVIPSFPYARWSLKL